MLNRINSNTDNDKLKNILHPYLENKKSDDTIITIKDPITSTIQIFDHLEMARNILDHKLVDTHHSVRRLMRQIGFSSSVFSFMFFILVAKENENTERNVSLGIFSILFLLFLKISIDANRPNSFLYRKCLNHSYNKKIIYEENGIPRQISAELAPDLTNNERLIIQKASRNYNNLSEKQGLGYEIDLNITKENYSRLYEQLTNASNQKKMLINQEKRDDALIQTVNQFQLFGPKAPGPIINIILDFLGCSSKEELFKKNHYK